MSYKVVVDSCCDLTAAQFSDPIFSRVPLTIQVGAHTFVDDASLDQNQLLWQMKACETAPSTACPSPQQYADAFDCGVDDVYVVCLSAMLRGEPFCWKKSPMSMSIYSTPAPPLQARH